jgi:hypothetical protein
MAMRPQDIGDARKREHIPRKAIEGSQPKREGMWTRSIKIIGAVLYKPVGSYFMTLHALDTGIQLQDVMLALLTLSCFGPIPLFYVPILPFWNWNIYHMSLYLGSM